MIFSCPDPFAVEYLQISPQVEAKRTAGIQIIQEFKVI